MRHLINFLIAFGIVFIFELIFVVFNKKKRNRIFSSYGALILKGKYKIDFENVNKKKFALIITLCDAFICGVGYMILRLFKNVYIGFLVVAVALIILIIGVYSIVGYFYKKKEGKKNV